MFGKREERAVRTVRVAALQFASGVDCEKNRQKILAMIDRAALQKPDLMVLPEFCNHASWYAGAEHCYEVSWSLDGAFVAEVARKAREHRAYVVLNVTLRREGQKCTGSSILFDREGRILAVSDKQVLMGHENDFLQRATQITPVVETEIGRLGLYACMDGVIAETPRDLARRGAQILCNSLNSFAVDEASLHVPVRAAENKVFVVAANKVGPLIPEEQLAAVSQMTCIPQHFLHGAGESQIVAPDGTVLARASLANEEIIVADIDPSLADRKRRPDGNPIFAHRRPELYQPLAEKPKPIAHSSRSKAARVACWQGQARGHGAIQELVEAIPELDARYDLVVLPELFFVEDLAQVQLGQTLELSTAALAAIEKALEKRKLHVVGSFLLEGRTRLRHYGILLGKDGILLQQAQLHQSARYGQYLELGDSLPVVELGFGKVAMVVGEDAIYPEVFRLLALAGVDLVVVAGHVQERWELETGLVERAAENRICLAFASRPQAVGASLLADLESDFTLLTPWKERIFDGKINMPLTRLAPRFPGVYGHTLNLDRAHNKVISARTHLLDDRPWALLGSTGAGQN
jgi:predicted amidohydrolase